MRQFLHRIIERTPLAPLAAELDERLWQLKGIRRGTFSQHGEDRIIRDYFGGRTGIYVDVGANYPIKISNTYLLYRDGWRGLTVEPIPRLSRRHRRLRPRDIHINAAVSSIAGEMTFYELNSSGLSTFDRTSLEASLRAGWRLKGEYKVPVSPLSDLVARALGDVPVDLLTVDTEGHDRPVFESIDWSRFRPRLIVYEVGYGDPELDAFIWSKGYRLFKRLGCNVIAERVD